MLILVYHRFANARLDSMTVRTETFGHHLQAIEANIVTLDVDAAHPDQYRTPEGWRGFEHVTERLESTDTAPESMDVRWTIWGPVLDVDRTGRPRAYSWVAHSAERLAASLLPLETVRTVDEAFDRANGAGIPGQNLVAVDR